jgi:hypothetical protein
MMDLDAWLEERLADAPESLRGRVLAAMRDHAAQLEATKDTMRNVADALLDEAKSGPPDHGTALTLLAADALVTFWCEATAEADTGALAELK